VRSPAQFAAVTVAVSPYIARQRPDVGLDTLARING
jgi:hypothetical protein